MSKHNYDYIGDCDLYNGGIYIDLSNWDSYGYANAVEVVDLDSAIGFTGAVAIHPMTINKSEASELPSILSVVGDKPENNPSPLDIAYACFAYGKYDDDRSYETLQLQRDGEMEFQGWTAERRVRSNFNLRKYVESQYLK